MAAYPQIDVVPSSPQQISYAVSEPDATADLSNFKLLSTDGGVTTPMANCGAIAIRINGAEYVIPVLQNT